MSWGRRTHSTTIEDLAPSRARYLPNGSEVFNESRERLAYEKDGRRWSPFVERGDKVYSVYLALEPCWHDGTPMTRAELDEGIEAVTAVLEHWKVDVVDIVRPDR